MLQAPRAGKKGAAGVRAPKPRRRLVDVLAAELAVLQGADRLPPPAVGTAGGGIGTPQLSTAGVKGAAARSSPAVMYLEAAGVGSGGGSSAAGDGAATLRPPPAPPLCSVCGFASKYACVRCRAPFCVQACLNAHRDSGRCSASGPK